MTVENEEVKTVVVEEPAVVEEAKVEETKANPAKETPKEEPAKADDAPKEEVVVEPTDTVDYTDYKEPELKGIVNIFKENGIKVEDAGAIFAEAIKSNDITKIDSAKLVELVGEDKASLVTVLASKYYKEQFDTFNKIKEDVSTMVGGEAVYDNMVAWAAEKGQADKAFAEEFTTIKEMIDSGKPLAVKAAFKELFALYKADPKTTIRAKLVKGDSTAKGSGLEPLTSLEYGKAVERSRRDGTYEQVRANLWARRQQGIKQKI